jgi:hypothetical protein
MRDHVEAFVENGGNVCFFSGDVCWWQVRFEDGGRTMVCYKNAAQDPLAAVDAARTTVLWRDPPVNRPENHLTGVSFAAGAGWWNGDAGPRPQCGYRVRFPQHWVVDTTGLQANGDFGADDSIVGYETDAALFNEIDGIPVATGQDGTPPNFILLGTADLTAWGPGGQAGWATMGIDRNNGLVFTAATTDWSRGLRGSWNEVSQITRNLLRRLGYPPQSTVLRNRGFEKWQKAKQPDGGALMPDGWTSDGPGSIRPSTEKINGRLSVDIDAKSGETGLWQSPWTWLSTSGTGLRGLSHYRAGCWTRTCNRGATIRLQVLVDREWQDFGVAEHSGSGAWEYLCAVGRVDQYGPLFKARVKLQVAGGNQALFDDVLLDAL